MTSTMVSFRANQALAPELDARGCSRSAVTLRDLSRYYATLATAEREMGMSEGEWNFLRDILNGSVLDERTADYLWAEVQDAEPACSERWGIDAADLAGRIRTWPAIYRLAAVDAVERWWRSQH